MAQAHGKQHDYHLLDPSPWPLTASLSAFITAVGTIIWLRSMGEGAAGLFGVQGPWVFALGFRQASQARPSCGGATASSRANRGDHTPVVQLHLRYGIILFIASEVMFFVAWFWAYFDFSLFPNDVHDREHEGSRRHGSRATSCSVASGRRCRLKRPMPPFLPRALPLAASSRARLILGASRWSTR